MKKILLIAVAIVVIIIAVVFAGKGSTNQEGDIVIGAALSLSGAAVQDGESIKNGIELARADLKARGIDVKVIYQDDKTESKDTVSAINALGAQGVQAIIGPTWSYLGDAGVPVADKLKIVAVMPANTSEYVGAKSDYAFYTTTKVEKASPVLTKWLKETNKKKIAVIRNQGSWYDVVEKALKKSAQEAGSEIVFSEELPYGADAAAVATMLTKVKSSKADLLFFEVDDDQATFAMLKKVNEQKIPVDIVSVTTAIGRVASDISLDNSVYILAPIASKEFADKYKAAYGKAVPPYADSSYDSLMLLVDALQKKGDMPLNSYLRDKTSYEGFAKVYDFDANGDITGGAWAVTKLK